MAHNAAHGKRLVQRSSGRRYKKSSSLPQQQFDDLCALSSSLDFEYGVDVGYQLGSLAKHQRALNDLYIGPGLSNASATNQEQLLRHAGQISIHNSSTHWPLYADQIPMPNFTLADEVAAIAQRHMSVQKLGSLTRETAATSWMAASHALSRTLAHLGLLPPSNYPAEIVQKDADKAARASISESPRKSADSMPSKSQLAQRRLLTRSLTWRDVLDAIYTTGEARAHRAADRVHERMADLYGSYFEELQLERRTWSMKSWPDIQEKKNLVKLARQRADQVAIRSTPMEIWEAACAEPVAPSGASGILSDGWDEWRWGSGWEVKFPEHSDEILRQVLAWDSEEEIESDLEMQNSLSEDDHHDEEFLTRNGGETASETDEMESDTSSRSNIPNPIPSASQIDAGLLLVPSDLGNESENHVSSTSKPRSEKKRQRSDVQSHPTRRSQRRLNSERSYGF
ncbi:hypothetical protein MPSI1_003035 [Malassezia psittaci]|uniref:Uncharacterized protein n=1 Tax=Malassezia psittaci TaxID=1821823 RepID=A0AAF0JET0_9BASI|nr:hypothetical protein MPSI1_003035 [Malassezia psittaci]